MPWASLDEAFCAKFDTTSMPESLNEAHELVLVAGQLDDSSERIISYLADEYGVAINAVFFRFFRDGDNEYLSRAWLTDPGEVDAKVIEKREKGQWNGEFYVSFGHGLMLGHEQAAAALRYVSSATKTTPESLRNRRPRTLTGLRPRLRSIASRSGCW